MKRFFLALAAGLLMTGTALAQASAAPQTGQDSEPRLPSPSEQTPGPAAPDAGGGATLSDKLEKSDGVLKPPSGVDPEIKEVPPQSGSSMPVIKPPGNAR